jgi:hypothetical protein
MYINLLLIHTSYFIMTGLKNIFINAVVSSLKNIRDKLAAFIVLEIISPKRRNTFQTIGFELDDSYSLCSSYLIHRLCGQNDEHFV